MATLQGALTHSLQLSAVINSVLGIQGDQQYKNMDTLPDNTLVSHASKKLKKTITTKYPPTLSSLVVHLLLAGDVTSQSVVGSSPPHHTLPTLTGSDSPCSTNGATDSTDLLEAKRTKGAMLKLVRKVAAYKYECISNYSLYCLQTPSVDSGLASHFTSILQSDGKFAHQIPEYKYNMKLYTTTPWRHCVIPICYQDSHIN